MTVIDFHDASGPQGMRIYAVGDVHGRLDLLQEMLARIDADLRARPVADWRVILLGDYIDRGPDSKGVLDLLVERRRADPHFIALCGNHDTGLTYFLKNPAVDTLFAGHGGQETGRSYGVEADFGSDEQAQAAARELAKVIPAVHLDLIAAMPRSVEFGDFFFSHAGIRPGVALDKQDPDGLIWIRGEFLRFTGLHPKVIVHGHTPHSEAEILPNRVNVDTYAVRTGRLTALVIDGAKKELMSVEGPASRPGD